MKSARYQWTDKVEPGQLALVPAPKDLPTCQRQFKLYEWYTIPERRSEEEHRQFFAVLAEAWAQLPEGYKEIYGTAEKLRADTLIDNNFSHTQFQGCPDEDYARRWASWIRKREKYTRVSMYGPVLKLESPESMAIDETGKMGMPVKRFREAKRLCFEQWAHMIGVSVDELVQQSTHKRHAA